MSLQFTSNGHARDLLALYELPEDVREQFSYVDADSDDAHALRFFRYHDAWYDTRDCEPVHPGPFGLPEGHPISAAGWHGYFSETYFSGVVFRYVDPHDDEAGVVVGRYYAADD